VDVAQAETIAQPHHLTTPLLKHFSFTKNVACVVSGDTVSKQKPDPQPLLYACDQINADPKHCVYIGDAQRDIEAGNRAGMMTIIALYGYIPANDDTNNWNATGTVSHADELRQWF